MYGRRPFGTVPLVRHQTEKADLLAGGMNSTNPHTFQQDNESCAGEVQLERKLPCVQSLKGKRLMVKGLTRIARHE